MLLQLPVRPSLLFPRQLQNYRGPMLQGLARVMTARSSSSRLVTRENVRIGAQVRRGPDWNHGDEDGGIGGIGRILDKKYATGLEEYESDPNYCVVCWGCDFYSVGSVCNFYSVGQNGKYDLLYVYSSRTQEDVEDPLATLLRELGDSSRTQKDGEDPLVTLLRKLGDFPDARKRCATKWLEPQQKRLWKQRKFTDAEVVVGTSRLPVHRATLCAASPVFAAAFGLPPEEGRSYCDSTTMQHGRTAVCTVRDAEPATVEAMLRFVYTGELLSEDDSPDPAKLLELAALYQVGSLAPLDVCSRADGEKRPALLEQFYGTRRKKKTKTKRTVLATNGQQLFRAAARNSSN